MGSVVVLRNPAQAATRAGGGAICAAPRRPVAAAARGGAAAAAAPRGSAWPLHLVGARRLRRGPPAAAAGEPEPTGGGGGDPGGSGGLVGSVGLFGLWAGLAGYAFLLSPNQTPLRDQYFLEKLLGLTSDPVPLNAVFVALFFVMGVWPVVYSALLVPAGRSGNGVPAWPFLTASYAVGAFGLLPFMALWTPPRPAPALPPARAELEGPRNLLARGMESPLVAYGAAAGALYCLGAAAAAGPAAWAEFGRLFQESRFTHVMTLDFLTLTALAPFWVANDAAARRWDGPLAAVCAVPLLGPVAYLCLRPRAEV